MQAQKFYATNITGAMREIRRKMGPDAVILQTQHLRPGEELVVQDGQIARVVVLAAPPEGSPSLPRVESPPAPRPARTAPPAATDSPRPAAPTQQRTATDRPAPQRKLRPAASPITLPVTSPPTARKPAGGRPSPREILSNPLLRAQRERRVAAAKPSPQATRLRREIKSSLSRRDRPAPAAARPFSPAATPSQRKATASPKTQPTRSTAPEGKTARPPMNELLKELRQLSKSLLEEQDQANPPRDTLEPAEPATASPPTVSPAEHQPMAPLFPEEAERVGIPSAYDKPAMARPAPQLTPPGIAAYASQAEPPRQSPAPGNATAAPNQTESPDRDVPALLPDHQLSARGLQQRLRRHGVEDILIRRLIERLHLRRGARPEEVGATEAFAAVVEDFIPRHRPDSDAPGAEEPRCLALVGPTGVGKTTTLAKIASHYALDRDENVVLVTLDTYRVAAAEQLKTYGRLLGVPVEVLNRADELAECLARHADADRILIDTPGHSPHDQGSLEPFARALRAQPGLETQLVLSAPLRGREMRTIMQQFEPFAYRRLVFSKLDEASSYGELLNTWILGGVAVSYFTTGQRVPEDLKTASVAGLCRRLVEEDPRTADA